VNNRGRPSDRATAEGGRTSSTVANWSTSSSRRRGAAKRATTYRDNMAYTQSFEARGGEPLGQRDNTSCRKKISQLNYMDIRKLIDKRSVQLKKGLLTEAEIWICCSYCCYLILSTYICLLGRSPYYFHLLSCLLVVAVSHINVLHFCDPSALVSFLVASNKHSLLPFPLSSSSNSNSTSIL
jgi:hypothetical protein